MSAQREALITLVRAADEGKPESAMAVLVPRLEAARGRSRTPAEYLEPLDRFRHDSYDADELEGLIGATLAALDAWKRHGGKLQERIDAVAAVSPVLRSRLLALHLASAVEDDAAAIASWLAGEIRSVRAHPEGLALARALFATRRADIRATLLDGLGVAPSALDVARLPSSEPLPDDWLRAHGWLVAFPSVDVGEWRDAEAVITGRVGEAPLDGRLIGDVTTWVGPTSPYQVEDLVQMGPVPAAEAIGAWRPSGVGFAQPTPRGLERALTEVVKRDPRAWASDPLALLSRLRHPTYVGGWFEGLAQTASELEGLGDDLANAVVVVDAEPWEPSPLVDDPFEADPDWDNARLAGIKLLKALWQAGVDLGDSGVAAWQLVREAAMEVSAATAVSGDAVDDLTAALNRPFTRALDAAFAFAGAEHKKLGALPEEFLDLLDRTLDLDGESGAQARAIVALRAPFLRAASPAWFARAVERLFGEAAGERLGERAFDVYVGWGRPDRVLLEELRGLYERAVRRGNERALEHLLLGMLWDLPGLSPSEIMRLLLAVGDAAVSAAGRALASMLRGRLDRPVVDRAAAFWDQALSAKRGAAAYQGFGWMANVSAIDDDRWLHLMSRTVAATGGAIEVPQLVADRASQHPDDPRALGLVAALLTTDVPLWHVHRVGGVALELLRSSAGIDRTEASRAQLRERLLERGYYEARDVR